MRCTSVVRLILVSLTLCIHPAISPPPSSPSYLNHYQQDGGITTTLHINTAQCVFKTDPRFLSVAIDSSIIRYRWPHFNFSSEKLLNLAKGLQPAFLRIGGTLEDFLIFDKDATKLRSVDNDTKVKVRKNSQGVLPSIAANIPRILQLGNGPTIQDQSQHHIVRTLAKIQRTLRPLVESTPKQSDDYTNFTMTAEDVDNLFPFADRAGLEIIFGLNVLLRTPQGDWDSSNAQELMEYLVGKGYHCAWELGNEPFDLKGLINKTIEPEQLAKDFTKLRKLLTSHPEYGKTLFGPDVSSPWRGDERPAYLQDFLRHLPAGTINAMTYHQYYTNNQATASDFHDPKLLDDLIEEMQGVHDLMRKSGASHLPPYLGETASAYDGGVPNVSDSYVAGFTWLDKLGLAARFGHPVVVRQTFYHGNYALIQEKTYDPFPDYWVSLLYKRLVSPVVLEVQHGLDFGRTVRTYAHCTSSHSNYPNGSIVILALNTLPHESQLVFSDDLHGLPVDQYVLTPGHAGKLTSTTMKLNGDILKMVDDKFLPDLKPQRIAPPQKITLPPVSYGFFVIPDAKAQACTGGCHTYGSRVKI